MLQADAAGRTKGEKKREKTSTSSKENFEQNNNGGSNGTKREKKRVSPSNVTNVFCLDLALVPFCCRWKENNQGGGKSLEKDTDDRETCCLHPHHALF